MPFYTFRCGDCDASREIMTDLGSANDLELVCMACGGSMTKAPVMKLTVIGPATAAQQAANDSKAEQALKPCGHNYQCRCGIRMTKANPFKQEIKAAHGFVDED